MTRPRPGLVLLAAAGLALLPSCARRPPAGVAVPVEAPFAAAFRATVSGDGGRLRLAGVLAAGPGGRLRVEIARGGESFLLVSGGHGQTATLSTGSLFMDEAGEADLIAGITGTALRARDVSAALRGDAASAPEGCTLESGRWRPRQGDDRIPTRIRLACGAERLKLRLEDPILLGPLRAERAFAPLEPPGGYRRVGADGMVRAIWETLSGR